MESLEHHRPPQNIRMAQSGVSAPPIFMPPTVVPPQPPIYINLPPHLAQQYAALSDLYLRRHASLAPGSAPQLAPAFVPAPIQYPNLPADLALRVTALPPVPQLAPAFVPAPAPERSQYANLPADLALWLAALPLLIEHSRSRGRGRGRGRGNVTAPAPAPLTFAEQYAAVCLILFVILR